MHAAAVGVAVAVRELRRGTCGGVLASGLSALPCCPALIPPGTPACLPDTALCRTPHTSPFALASPHTPGYFTCLTALLFSPESSQSRLTPPATSRVCTQSKLPAKPRPAPPVQPDPPADVGRARHHPRPDIPPRPRPRPLPILPLDTPPSAAVRHRLCSWSPTPRSDYRTLSLTTPLHPSTSPG